MSIPLESSPFRNRLPCRFAKEKGTEYTCESSSSQCVESCSGSADCPYYKPADESTFRNNTSFSLMKHWIRKKDGDHKCYFVCSYCGAESSKMSNTNADKYLYQNKYCRWCGNRMYAPEESIKDIEPGIYQHFKGKFYKVLCTCEHTETGEKLVVYQALYGNYTTYCRPLHMFAEDVEDLYHHYRGPRFRKVDNFLTASINPPLNPEN